MSAALLVCLNDDISMSAALFSYLRLIVDDISMSADMPNVTTILTRGCVKFSGLG